MVKRRKLLERRRRRPLRRRRGDGRGRGGGGPFARRALDFRHVLDGAGYAATLARRSQRRRAGRDDDEDSCEKTARVDETLSTLHEVARRTGLRFASSFEPKRFDIA